VAKDISLDEVREEFIALRDSVNSVQMATLDSNHLPDVSYANFVWYKNACNLFLSDLAQHGKNLKANPAISVLMIESEAKVSNQFARKRIVLKGKVELIPRSDELFDEVMAQFRGRFGPFIDVIQSFEDFKLFRLMPSSGQYVRGFAQAFELTGERLEQFVHINPGA
jgi:putative heme iron utilization protein